MQILQVVPITQSTTAEVLSYFSARPVRAGMIVTVPLRRQTIQAIVVDTEEVTDMKLQLKGAAYQIKNVIEVHDLALFSEAFLATAAKIKNYYASSTGRIIDHMTPSIITKYPEEFTRPISLEQQRDKQNISQRNLLLQQPAHERISYYRILLREKFLQKESVHIFCPTQESATRIYQELLKNNEGKVFVLHSGINKKVLKETFAHLYTTDSPSCLISTPRFIDIYQYNLASMIIEEESSEYYFTIKEPIIDYRIALGEYAKQKKLECIWADSVLRPENYVQYEQKNAELIEPFNKHILEKERIQVIQRHKTDPQKQNDQERIQEIIEHDKEYNIFNTNIEKELRMAVRKKEKIFIFIPRKSLAPNILCRDCGNLARSPESGFPYSLFIKNKKRVFICVRTGEQIPAFDICQFCGGWGLTPFGIGTETIKEYCEIYFPRIPAFIVDGNHITKKSALEEVQEEYAKKGRATIIIGTQKAVPLFPRYNVSIMLGLDTYFSRMNYAINSILIKRILDIAEKSDRIFIQSQNILEEFLPILGDGMYLPFIKNELHYRKEYHYPPFTTIIKIIHPTQQKSAKRDYQNIAQFYREYDPHIIAQPGPKKSIHLVVVITLALEQWNINQQNPRLLKQLRSLNRKNKILINPSEIY